MTSNNNRTQRDYEKFWSQHPTVKNPSDINSEAKYNYAMKIGWRRLAAMQAARKRGEEYTWNPRHG